MNTATIEAPDLTKFSKAELKAALWHRILKKSIDFAYKNFVNGIQSNFKLAAASEVLSNAKTEVFVVFRRCP
jgi:hypothetical protein